MDTKLPKEWNQNVQVHAEVPKFVLMLWNVVWMVRPTEWYLSGCLSPWERSRKMIAKRAK